MSSVQDRYVAAVINRPIGYAQYTNLSAVVDLDDAPAAGKRIDQLKGACSRALIQAEAQAIRWTDDPDVAPSDTVGMVIPAGTTLEYDGDLSQFRMIQDAAGAIANITYYN